MTDFSDQAENRGWTNKIKSHQYSCTYMNFGALCELMLYL